MNIYFCLFRCFQESFAGNRPHLGITYYQAIPNLGIGAAWQRERFDQIVRDEPELIERINDIANNPARDGRNSRNTMG